MKNHQVCHCLDRVVGTGQINHALSISVIEYNRLHAEQTIDYHSHLADDLVKEAICFNIKNKN